MKSITFIWRPDLDPQPVERPLNDMRPKELLLASMGMCAAMTAAAFFAKMRLAVSELRVETSGGIEGDPARADSVYSSFVQRFTAYCLPGERERVAHALELTYGKYCGVGTMLARVAPVSYHVVIEERP